MLAPWLIPAVPPIKMATGAGEVRWRLKAALFARMDARQSDSESEATYIVHCISRCVLFK